MELTGTEHNNELGEVTASYKFVSKESELRDEWDKNLASGIWKRQVRVGGMNLKELDLDEVANYWLSKRKQELEEIAKELEGMKSTSVVFPGRSSGLKEGWNDALSEAITKIRSRI